MPSVNYRVDGSNPIPVYPAGLQGARTVLNTGAVTVYLSDTATDLVGYPVASGAVVRWAAGVALYARTAPGDVGNILVADAAEIMPFGNVDVTGAVTTSGLSLLTALDYADLTTGVIDCSAYGSLQILPVYVGNTSLTDVPVLVRFYADAAGTVLVAEEYFGSGASSAYSFLARITVPVWAPYVEVALTDISALNAGTVRVYGQYARVPEAFYFQGDPTTYAVGTHRQSNGSTGTIGNGASASAYPALYHGDADLAIRFVTATAGGSVVVNVTSIDGTVTIFRETIRGAVAADTSFRYRLYLPRRPVRVQIANFSGGVVSFAWALNYAPER